MVVVHGGGNVISDWMQRQGIPPRFVNGLRVTDAPSLDIVVAVLTGLINKELVCMLHNLGGRAVGISGIDGGIPGSLHLPTRTWGFRGRDYPGQPRPPASPERQRVHPHDGPPGHAPSRTAPATPANR